MELEKPKKTFKIIGICKAYAVRAQSYISILNSAMIFIVLLKSFDITLRWYWWPLMIIIAIVIFLIIGMIDTELGIRSAEIENNATNNPVLMRMDKNIKSIKDEFIRPR